MTRTKPRIWWDGHHRFWCCAALDYKGSPEIYRCWGRTPLAAYNKWAGNN